MMKFGALKSDLKKVGRMLPDADILNAATAILKGHRLITGNTDHFSRFEELSIEDWIE